VTPKQEAFVREYLVDLNATQAAIRAGFSAKTAYSAGQRALKNVEVAAAITDARRKLAARADFTVDAHMDELAKIRDAAFKAQQYSAASKAEMARGKVAGFYVDRIEMNAKVLGTVAYTANMPKRGTS
jgi:phage terminase small subunit